MPRLIYNLIITKENYFNSAVKNFELANTSVIHMQASVLTIVLAELAFLGTSELAKSHPPILSVVSAILLLLSLFIFIVAINIQRGYALRAGRQLLQLSRDVEDYAKKHKVKIVKELPSELSAEAIGANTSRVTNRLFMISFLIISIATLLIIILLVRKMV